MKENERKRRRNERKANKNNKREQNRIKMMEFTSTTATEQNEWQRTKGTHTQKSEFFFFFSSSQTNQRICYELNVDVKHPIERMRNIRFYGISYE